MLRKIIPVLPILLLAACSSQQQRHIQYLDGIDPVIQGASIKISTENQNSVFQSLYSRAGLSTDPKRNAEEWDDVIRAGMETDFSWQASGRKYEELYEQMLEGTSE